MFAVPILLACLLQGDPQCVNEYGNSLLHQVSVIGNDDRLVRRAGDVPDQVENAQARFYCVPHALKKKRKSVAKRDIVNGAYEVSNATFAFQSDVAISAEFSKIPGSDFDPRKQSTVVTLFDYRVLDAYRKLVTASAQTIDQPVGKVARQGASTNP